MDPQGVPCWQNQYLNLKTSRLGLLRPFQFLESAALLLNYYESQTKLVSQMSDENFCQATFEDVTNL